MIYYLPHFILIFVAGCAAGKTMTMYKRQSAIIILKEPETLYCKDTHKDHEWYDPDSKMHCLNDRVERALEVLR